MKTGSMRAACPRRHAVISALLMLGAAQASAQSSRDTAAARAIALTPASTFVVMNPAMFGNRVRGELDYTYAHKPFWRTSGIGLNVGNFRVQAGRGAFAFPPKEDEYFVGIDYAGTLLEKNLFPHLAFVVGADASLGYGAEKFRAGLCSRDDGRVHLYRAQGGRGTSHHHSVFRARLLQGSIYESDGGHPHGEDGETDHTGRWRSRSALRSPERRIRSAEDENRRGGSSLWDVNRGERSPAPAGRSVERDERPHRDGQRLFRVQNSAAAAA